MAVQLDLFDEPLAVDVQPNHLSIPGLSYKPQLLTPEMQRATLAQVDALPWQDDLKRRVQHYGYKYDYRARAIDPTMFVGPLPSFAVAIAQLLLDANLIDEAPDQLIVNEYQPGQGITAHVDCEPCFKNTIVTISLGSIYEMDFIHTDTGEVRSTLLELGSALVLRDASRYEWKHRIKARLSDNGRKRGRRISLTYRNVIVAACDR